jgi:thioredoxin-related protein
MEGVFMKKFVFLSLIFGLFAFGCSSVPVREGNSNTELIVQYEGKEVHRRNSKYVGEHELRQILNRGEEVVVIFSAEWCSNCKLAERAIKQAKLNTKVYYVNMDERWARELAKLVGFNTVPTMMHIDKQGNTISTKVGAGQIVTYLVIRF